MNLSEDKTIKFNKVNETNEPSIVQDLSNLPSVKIIKPGTCLGSEKRYQVTGVLGEGAMGKVYAAKDTLAETSVALKLVPQDVALSEAEMHQVRKNFQIVHELHHPNIAAVTQLEFDDYAGYFIVMEAVSEGKTLIDERLSRKNGKLSFDEAVVACKQVAAALDYAHEKKIVHRDIKPGNVLIEKKEGELKVKVTDFGLAAQIASSLSRTTRQKMDSSGTRPYMSPEQWLGKKQDGKTDQWALAVMFYELIAGEFPFPASDSDVLRSQVLNIIPEKPDAISNKQWKILLIALNKDKKKRFNSCGEFMIALETGTTKSAFHVLKVLAVVVVLLTVFAGYFFTTKNTEKKEIFNNQQEIINDKEKKEIFNNQQEIINVKEKKEIFNNQQEIINVKVKNPPTTDFSKNDAICLEVEAEDAINELKKTKFSQYQEEVSKADKLFRIGKKAKISDSYNFACESFIEITNIFAKAKIKTDYFLAKQKYELELKKTDTDLLDNFGGEIWKLARKNANLAKNSDSNYNKRTKYYKTAFSNLIDAFSNAKKNKYDDLITKIGVCNQQKMWIEAEKLANQAINSGYKDVSKAKNLLQEIKKYLIKKGDKKTIDLGNGVKMELMGIPKGSFKMGSNDAVSDEKPVHNVNISKGFWMGKFEVTQKQFQQIMGKNPSHFKNSGENAPVENVSWNDCKEFCKKLSEKTKLNVRLPTEAEWEYACRADTTTKYYSGNNESDLKKVGWYNSNSGSKTHTVGSKNNPNDFGLYDMHGNVWEWCEDWWNGSYKGAPDDGSPWRSGNSSYRVLRGGCWYSNASYCRAAFRYYISPECTNYGYGFRVVLAFL